MSLARENRILLARAVGALLVVADAAKAAPQVCNKERADRLEQTMRAMPMGDQLVDHALGGHRR